MRGGGVGTCVISKTSSVFVCSSAHLSRIALLFGLIGRTELFFFQEEVRFSLVDILSRCNIDAAVLR